MDELIDANIFPYGLQKEIVIYMRRDNVGIYG
jgi:hypothetical protein